MASSTNNNAIGAKLKMNNGLEIPVLGLGVYRTEPGESTSNSVSSALKIGYRHIDTARLYGNEESVGKAIRESGIPRNQIFVTTKLWDSDHGYDSTIAACEKSLKKLDIEYIDLYLIHSPNPGKEKRLSSWKAMEKMVEEGKVKSIGVSNYGIHHLKELFDSKPKILPAVNQVEIHPWLTRNKIVDYCQENNIIVEAYSPLTKGQKLNDPTLKKMASKYNKSTAQILIRYGIDRGMVTLPKSVHENRIKDNAEVFDFKLDNEDMKTLNSLDVYLVTGWDPTVAN